MGPRAMKGARTFKGKKQGEGEARGDTSRRLKTEADHWLCPVLATGGCIASFSANLVTVHWLFLWGNLHTLQAPKLSIPL